ncbi:MAG TPA: translation initiation factor IF-3 [Candidatus Paceibacterota bacterium]|nr:translation initiation factor IF-3 [Candidatus Paceibacterota bacterium]HOK97297.1 translation initiation factor IF-3 [Candidatus Paceibacterota bacterium]HPP64733.1 translation initiation factor IF-3 [Candidatus Paceibacterota bacterium]
MSLTENSEIRLIDENGKFVGLLSFKEALELAKQKNLDLVLKTDKTIPAVYQLGDRNKIKYLKEKKLKKLKLKEKQNLPKIIRLGFNEGIHDIQVKAKKADEFLEENRVVTIEMKLRGREKAHLDLAEKKMKDFISLLKTPVNFTQPLKKIPMGFIMSIKKI